MKAALRIVQSLLLPKLEKDAHFDATQTTSAFWEDLTTALLDFETNPKPAHDLINSLHLHDAEKINATLTAIYATFIKELAEWRMLGIPSEAIDYLIASDNSSFKKEVQFYTDLKNAITKVERKRMKAALPNSVDKLAFELNDDLLHSAITKKSRDDLKKKMAGWDQQLVETKEAVSSELANKKESKVIYLGWVKYAAAACLVLGLGIWFYNHQQAGFTPDTNVVTTPQKDTTKSTQLPEIPVEALAEVTIETKIAAVIESGMGYASSKIKIAENNQRARKISIEKAIEKYRQLLEREFPANKAAYGARAESIQEAIVSLEKELATLNDKEHYFGFDGKALVLYVSDHATENTIVFYEENYYLKRETTFYKLTIAQRPQLYKKERNAAVINALTKIYNGY